MKSEGMSEYTIRDYERKLKHISINCNIEKPEEVKTFIANKKVATATKKIFCSAYDYFCKYLKI